MLPGKNSRNLRIEFQTSQDRSSNTRDPEIWLRQPWHLRLNLGKFELRSKDFEKFLLVAPCCRCRCGQRDQGQRGRRGGRVHLHVSPHGAVTRRRKHEAERGGGVVSTCTSAGTGRDSAAKASDREGGGRGRCPFFQPCFPVSVQQMGKTFKISCLEPIETDSISSSGLYHLSHNHLYKQRYFNN